MVDSSTGSEMVSFGGTTTSVTALALSADGKQLAAVTNATPAAGQQLKLWASDASEPQAVLWTSPDRIDHVCFSPNGKYVAASSGAGLVIVWDVRSHAEVARFRGEPGVHALAFSPNSEWLADSGKQIVLHRVDNWRSSRSIPTSSDARAIAFSPDGTRVIAVLSDGAIVWLATAAGAGTPPKSVRRPSSGSRPMVAMSSDGAAMAVASDRGSTVVSSTDGRVLSAFDESLGGSATAVAFQPGSRIVVLAGVDGVGRMFDSDTGRLLKTLDFQDNDVHGLAFTPDGRGLIIGSEARSTTVSRGLRPANRPGVNLADRRDYAIMFATNDYDHWPDLVNPIPDAETLKAVLENDYGFEVKIVSNPTREQVLSELRTAHQRTFGPADQLLIFFAGHGTYDREIADGFVVAKDSLDGDRNHTSQISYSDLRTKIDSLPAGHILVAMDVCQGGMMLGSGHRGSDDYGRLSIADLLAKKMSLTTRKLLASGLDDYVADGVPGRHSPFVSALLTKLRSYGGADGYITSAALFGSLQSVKPGPVMGNWGKDDPGSEFFFIPRETQAQLAAAVALTPAPARTASTPEPSAAVRVNSPTRPTIAVLPFRNLKGPNTDQYLSSIVEAQLWSELKSATTLRTLDALQVGQAVREQHWERPDEMTREQLAWAAQNLGADLLLTGTYARLGTENVVVNFRVVDTRDARLLYQNTGTGKEDDLASSILRQEGARLRRAVGAGEDSAVPVAGMPQNSEAAALYANALKKIGVNEFAPARDLLEKLVVVEPTFSLGHARLAEVYSSLGYDARARFESKAAYEAREGLGPNDAKLVEAQYFAAHAEWEKAIAAFTALWSYNSDTIDYALGLAQVLTSSGEGTQAVRLLEEVKQRAPAPADALRIDIATARAYMDMGDFRHLKSTAAKAIADAERLQSEAVLAEALLYDSIASRRLGDATTALAAAQRGLKIVADSNALLRARLLTAAGNAYGQRGESDNEIRAKSEALQVARAAEDQKDLAGALINLANIMLGRGDFEQATSYYREAIAVTTKIEDLHGEGLAKFNLASLLKAKGDLNGARDLLEESERLYRTVHNDLRAERARYELAIILLENGQIAEAHRRLVASRAGMARFGGGDELSGVMLSLGDTLAAEGDLKGASDQYEQAAAICAKSQSPECTAAYQVSAASLLVVEGQFEKAAALANAAAQTYRTAEYPDGEVDARAALATALLGQNLPQQALAEVEKAEALKVANRLSGIYLAIQASRVRAANSGGQPKALERLQALAKEARELGAMKAQLEAELALVQIDGAAYAALKEALRKQAGDLGYGLIARLASR